MIVLADGVSKLLPTSSPAYPGRVFAAEQMATEDTGQPVAGSFVVAKVRVAGTVGADSTLVNAVSISVRHGQITEAKHASQKPKNVVLGTVEILYPIHHRPVDIYH